MFPGKNPTDQYLEEMMNCAPGPINFTMFLTMFGEKLNGTDPEDVIKNAFACFDETNCGKKESQLPVLSAVFLLPWGEDARRPLRGDKLAWFDQNNGTIYFENISNKDLFTLFLGQEHIIKTQKAYNAVWQ